MPDDAAKNNRARFDAIDATAQQITKRLLTERVLKDVPGAADIVPDLGVYVRNVMLQQERAALEFKGDVTKTLAASNPELDIEKMKEIAQAVTNFVVQEIASSQGKGRAA